MNNVQKGYCRDNKILDLIENYRALDTNQIANLAFDGKAKLRKAQERLKKLHDKKRVKRTRLSIDTPFVYFTDRKSGRLEHLLMINWVLVWLIKGMSAWEKLLAWNYEENYKILQADAFCYIQNTFTKAWRFYFIEVDRAASGNKFDKVAKYNQLFEEELYLGSWWLEHTNKFPTVLIATDSETRLQIIRKCIRKENRNGLKFEVKLYSEILREVL